MFSSIRSDVIKAIQLAVNLYAASLSDVTSSAHVIGLSTTLEALLQPKAVHPAVKAHIDTLLQDFKSRRDQQNESAEQHAEFDRLRSRLANLQHESISQRLRHLVVSYAEALEETPEEAAHNITAAYGVRCNLLHEGHTDVDAIRRADSWLQKAVPNILDTIIAQACATEV